MVPTKAAPMVRVIWAPVAEVASRSNGSTARRAPTTAAASRSSMASADRIIGAGGLLPVPDWLMATP